eukprot:TRINITY_DN3534_c0_g1_i1.p1 TRINITY_DN3534_c0_g1~~TRINITY_DN3534_c0_g1_i1.p1  ORF type:complete len:286 (-),score=53.56 TRINITY_DN3534_c0_g1_i1:278-1135(-)
MLGESERKVASDLEPHRRLIPGGFPKEGVIDKRKIERGTLCGICGNIVVRPYGLHCQCRAAYCAFCMFEWIRVGHRECPNCQSPIHEPPEPLPLLERRTMRLQSKCEGCVSTSCKFVGPLPDVMEHCVGCVPECRLGDGCTFLQPLHKLRAKNDLVRGTMLDALELRMPTLLDSHTYEKEVAKISFDPEKIALGKELTEKIVLESTVPSLSVYCTLCNQILCRAERGRILDSALWFSCLNSMKKLADDRVTRSHSVDTVDLCYPCLCKKGQTFGPEHDFIPVELE